MQRALRPWVTAGIALTGASMIAITPVAQSIPELQRAVRLVDVAHGVNPFPEVGWNDFFANTTANWNGLMELFHNTTALYSLPEAAYTEGLPKVFNDLTAELQQLATYLAAAAQQSSQVDPTGPLPPLPNFFADPVLNPVSALTLQLQNGLASGFGANAAIAGLTGVYQNMLPSINDINTQSTDFFTQLKDVFNGGTVPTSAFQTDFTNIGNDVNNIGGFLSLAPSTALNDYLNGYPVVSAAPDPLAVAGIHFALPIPDAYTLNAPFTATTNPALTPEFGLLTNPLAAITADTGADGTHAGFLGTVPMDTGTLASLLQSEQTLSDELLTLTSSIPGSGVVAPAPTDSLTILGPDSLNITLDLSKIPVIGDVITLINTSIIPFLNTALTTTIGATNTVIDGVNTAVTGLSSVITATVNPFIKAIDGIITAINLIPGVDIKAIDPVTVNIPHIPDISITIPTIDTINPVVGDTFSLPGIVEPGVPAYVADLAQNEMAVLGSFAGIAAPVTGTVGSAEFGNFLADNPIMNLGTGFDSLMASIFAGSPLTITSVLPLDWTNLVAESLHSAFTAP